MQEEVTYRFKFQDLNIFPIILHVGNNAEYSKVALLH